MTAVLKPGLPNVDYYAPDFSIEVEGEELDPTTNGDILELKVVMDMDNMTSFDMTLSNWDDRTLFFKYSDTDTFNVGNRIHVKMGYAGELVSMVTGQISSMTPQFPDSGPPTLTVGGLDGLFKLRDRKPARDEITKYQKITDIEIAKAIAERNNLKIKTVESPADNVEHPEVIQKNQDDASFLMERAKRIDYDVFIVTDPDTDQSTLHFVPPTDGRDSNSIKVYQFRWGQNLISFSPTINLSRQVGSVTVRGWDDRTKQAIVVTAKPENLPNAKTGTADGKSGPKQAQDAMPGKNEIVVDYPVRSREEAEKLAQGLLAERAYEFITGNGEVIGLPDLRPGDNIELLDLGTRFSGAYYVKKVEHVINNSGYRSRFEVRRVFDGAKQP